MTAPVRRHFKVLTAAVVSAALALIGLVAPQAAAADDEPILTAPDVLDWYVQVSCADPAHPTTSLTLLPPTPGVVYDTSTPDVVTATVKAGYAWNPGVAPTGWVVQPNGARALRLIDRAVDKPCDLSQLKQPVVTQQCTPDGAATVSVTVPATTLTTSNSVIGRTAGRVLIGLLNSHNFIGANAMQTTAVTAPFSRTWTLSNEDLLEFQEPRPFLPGDIIEVSVGLGAATQLGEPLRQLDAALVFIPCTGSLSVTQDGTDVVVSGNQSGHVKVTQLAHGAETPVLHELDATGAFSTRFPVAHRDRIEVYVDDLWQQQATMLLDPDVTGNVWVACLPDGPTVFMSATQIGAGDVLENVTTGKRSRTGTYVTNDDGPLSSVWVNLGTRQVGDHVALYWNSHIQTDGSLSTGALVHQLAEVTVTDCPPVVTNPTGTVTIPGAATVGQTLTATTAGWSSAATLTFQWARAGKPITGATARTYKVTPADVGARLSVTVTATRAGAASATATAHTPAPVKAGTLKRGTVTISGAARVASTVKAVPAGWEATTTLRYQWLRNGTAISGATAAKYTAKPADVGKRLAVKVTGTRTGYTTVTLTSAPTKTVAKSTSSVTVKLAKKTISTSTRGKVTVTVTARGYMKVTGTVKVKVGKKTYTAKLSNSTTRKVTITLPKLKKGRYTLAASYTPSGTTARGTTASPVKRVSLRVR